MNGYRCNVLSSVGLVVHEEELDILDVANEESLVAGRHHVAGLLVGAIADLEARYKSRLVSRLIDLNFPIIFPTITRGASLSRGLGQSNPAVPVQIRSVFFHHRIMAKRTEGIARVPLKRRRTRLSIPLGLRHAESTRIKRSLWWRMKPLEPVHQYFVNILVPRVFASLFRRLLSGNGGDGVVGPRARASKGISIFFSSAGVAELRKNVRFLTIGTCFLAATILNMLLELLRY